MSHSSPNFSLTTFCIFFLCIFIFQCTGTLHELDDTYVFTRPLHGSFVSDEGVELKDSLQDLEDKLTEVENLAKDFYRTCTVSTGPAPSICVTNEGCTRRSLLVGGEMCFLFPDGVLANSAEAVNYCNSHVEDGISGWSPGIMRNEQEQEFIHSYMQLQNYGIMAIGVLKIESAPWSTVTLPFTNFEQYIHNMDHHESLGIELASPTMEWKAYPASSRYPFWCVRPKST